MKPRLTIPRRFSLAVASGLTLAFTLLGNPAWAGDPFRTTNPRNIGDNTEAAFDAIFREGNYPKALEYIERAERSEPQEPLIYAIRAAIAYTEEDWEVMQTYAKKTLQAAEKLQSDDQLRGNLYTAAGHFLEGAYNFKQEGPIGAVTKLQKVFEYLDKAEANSPNDPEMSLMKGYMELMLAVNLPFSSPDKAIRKFEADAAPEFLVNRGIAIAYRDLDEYEKALPYVNEALQVIPDNPELHYLKAQILHELGKKKKNAVQVEESVALFEQALAAQDQLPEDLIPQIKREKGIAQTWLNNQASAER